jgi:hypothetical protein
VSQTIVGRDLEKRELEEAYASKVAEFIALYGRRELAS